MWWSWVGYSWLTSVVAPEEGVVRFAMFAAMAGLLVVALCVPEAFGESAFLFACAYGLVRAWQIVLVALGLKKTLEHVGDPLETVPAVAMLGGAGLYLLAHVAFRWRNVHRFSLQRVVTTVALAAFLPVALAILALATLAVLAAALSVLIAYETVHFAELRDRLRHQLAGEAAAD